MIDTREPNQLRRIPILRNERVAVEREEHVGDDEEGGQEEVNEEVAEDVEVEGDSLAETAEGLGTGGADGGLAGLVRRLGGARTGVSEGHGARATKATHTCEQKATCEQRTSSSRPPKSNHPPRRRFTKG